MRVSSPGRMSLNQAVPTATRRRRWKRKTMLVLTDVSGAKQLSVLTRRCCLLAPCRRRLKRPRHRPSAISAVQWESAEEKLDDDDDEDQRSNTDQQHEEESNTGPSSQSLDGKVNGSLHKSRTLVEQTNGTEEAEEGTEQCVNTGLFTINGVLSGEPYEDFVDSVTASSDVIARLHFTAVNIGNEQSIVLMSPSQRLTFRGRCQLKCLYGNVQVFGFTVGQEQPPYHLYSLPTHAALTIEALPHCKPGRTKRDMKMEVKTVLRQHVPSASRHILMKEVTSSCSVLLLERLDTPETLFLSSFPEYKEIFTSHSKRMNSGKLAFHECAALSSIGVAVLPDDQGMNMSESWMTTVQELVKTCLEDDNGCPIILTCGGKNVGKSTFNRHLMNSLLNHVPCVEFLELDIGQTEFSPPGCMALHLVTKPVFSPPYMHQCEPRKMVYYGNVLCDRDPDRYMEVVRYLYAEYKKEAPLIINTMGWIKGLGLSVLVDLIRLLAPTHVVQLVNTRGSQDSVLLTSEFVQTATGWQTKGKHQIQQKPVDLRTSPNSSDEEMQMHVGLQGHKLMYIHSEFPGVEDGSCLKYRSNVLRDLALLGSFSHLQPLDIGHPLSLHRMLPYQVPFNAVALHVLHCDVTPTHILYAANASLVGLCRIPGGVNSHADGPVLLSQTPVCDCFGVGIIRGINLEKRLYYILTSVPVARLKQVNCLLVGAVTIPHTVFRNQPGVTGEVPYLTSDYSFTISGAGKIKVCRPLRRREHPKAVS
ncbi:polynucleotide 5'-hydroxyl-kinase NOL9 [Hypanus sabinus]|uniref:polynucleotide 5'-hydroxyl-kinase NOL9 n=1 Tax=Hypanus sabinus TaxID=79690 RepID=UPI0028C37D46|nr:polynucleotide 5'-hydroxyl-kinase NOL9 [Hypanus sabinus]XP_059808051.1 polynucleotide 5'-hydroxyl-kinase NOL9 [Hypanus sabinus]XP_059808052.1 polynucleotide 5'-hydroxyl-kinase NOL9 [Hypanus sabinus]XP_059808053.1 polynucleotide 5'-hydroxyl-kinase NOL9 [Hypanus sabinus]